MKYGHINEDILTKIKYSVYLEYPTFNKMINRRNKIPKFGLLSGLSIGVALLFLIFLHNESILKYNHPKFPNGLRIEPLFWWQTKKQTTKNNISSDFESILNLDQKDAQLVDYIRKHHLSPPSEKAYNITNPKQDFVNNYTSFVNDYFKNKTSGTFIEAGAYDGEGGSNTLYFELKGWKGLLVECNPHVLSDLKNKNRKAWVADVCLSTKDKSDKVNFFSPSEFAASGQIDRQLTVEEMKFHGNDFIIKNKTWEKFEERPSFPLYSIIAGTEGFKEIDFLSLDVQGAEIGVLKHFPFELIPIKLMIVEKALFSEEQIRELMNIMISKGYELIKDFGYDYAFALK